MAQSTIPFVSSPFFGEVLAGCLDQHIGRVERIILPKLHCCEFEDEFGCGELGVVTDLESERQYCRKHFQAVSR